MKFFSDRDLVARLADDQEPVLSAMKDWGIGRIDEHKHIQFCGVIHLPGNNPCFFLPREAKTGVYETDLQTASLTMQALARFGLEVSKREFEDEGVTGNPGILSVIKHLADDFQRFGIYSERTRRQTKNTGKPDWSRTVKRELAFISSSKSPVYPEIQTTRTQTESDIILAQIQAAVIIELKSAHGWWITALSERQPELRACSPPPFRRSLWAGQLARLLPTLYSARSIFLARYLGYYLENTRNSSAGNYIFGIEGFHSVWEVMLRETIIRHPIDKCLNWNGLLPKPVYHLSDSDKKPALNRGMQTDIILETPDHYIIVDAKYYSATTPDSAPGWPDIAKQLFYKHGLSEIIRSPSDAPRKKIENVFAFPGKSENGPLKQVSIRLPNGAPTSDMFSSILCKYFPVRKVLASYAKRKQEIHLNISAKSTS